jgi:hypothetical protein
VAKENSFGTASKLEAAERCIALLRARVAAHYRDPIPSFTRSQVDGKPLMIESDWATEHGALTAYDRLKEPADG